jgi:hypothetical protein
MRINPRLVDAVIIYRTNWGVNGASCGASIVPTVLIGVS